MDEICKSDSSSITTQPDIMKEETATKDASFTTHFSHNVCVETSRNSNHKDIFWRKYFINRFLVVKSLKKVLNFYALISSLVF